jgi:hypothetical protein
MHLIRFVIADRRLCQPRTQESDNADGGAAIRESTRFACPEARVP